MLFIYGYLQHLTNVGTRPQIDENTVKSGYTIKLIWDKLAKQFTII